ncbi:MAG: M15 family metallopeptidase [Candidatus Saccharibacteria bacterium]|nr:M15 family metallopeptidase [Candidatus Saccharibacteria bacterium]
MSKKAVLITSIVSLGLLLAGLFLYFTQIVKEDAPRETSHQAPVSNTEEESNDEPDEAAFDKTTYSLTEPGSIWQVVNKQRAISANYVPDDLVVPNVRLRLAASAEQMQFREVATDDLETMFSAADQEDIILVFGSGYRSYQLQKQFYDSYVARDGQAAADRYSARPGTSEHQTGISFDATIPDQTCHLEICFEDTPQGQWLAENAHKYGFHLRYREGKESITGYQYEPWHFRYVGKDLANELHRLDLTMEEFFNL